MPALNESEYYRNLGVELKPISAGPGGKPAVSTQIANDLLGDLGALSAVNRADAWACAAVLLGFV